MQPLWLWWIDTTVSSVDSYYNRGIFVSEYNRFPDNRGYGASFMNVQSECYCRVVCNNMWHLLNYYERTWKYQQLTSMMKHNHIGLIQHCLQIQNYYSHEWAHIFSSWHVAAITISSSTRSCRGSFYKAIQIYRWGKQSRDIWWRHQMETFSELLALCAGNSPVSGEFPAQRPVTRTFEVFFDLRPNTLWTKQWWGWWLETPSRSLWRHCND